MKKELNITIPLKEFRRLTAENKIINSNKPFMVVSPFCDEVRFYNADDTIAELTSCISSLQHKCDQLHEKLDKKKGFFSFLK